ncbi:MAG: YIP1 family protein [Deltaproteobacteria bacterium]|nr:YIP1 family protein [Deltaproteobacteria bacterium]MBW1953343.1 YIP1 family protein [Deltaproteobacteria bacterium]MBW1987317.1 YIP1 family protein [Deltaproteobacteria bacterium]MBW2135072.1 YIP1 family protein [Deltaproteobacteria bacterium]
MNLPGDWVENEEQGYSPPEVQGPIPWEDPEVPVLAALVNTIKLILLHPGEFFQNLTRQGGLSAPLGFALILGTTGMLASFYWQLIQLLLIGNLGSWLSFLVNKSLNLEPKTVVGVTLLVPLLVLVTQFIGSFFLQLALLLVGGRQPSYEAAFRVVAYANAPLIATFLPMGGGVIASLWCLILEFKALVRVFELSRLRALMALLLASSFSLLIFGLLTLVLGSVLIR